MENESTKLKGLIVPIATPLLDSGQVDETSLRKLIRHCIDGGANGVFFGGSAGMGPLLENDIWENAASIVRDEVADKAEALIGIIETSTKRAINKIKISQSLGYKNIVITPTYYITLQRDSEILYHFEACRNATEQDVIIYNIPSCVYSSISVNAMRTMLDKKWGVAVKESSGDSDYFRSVLNLGKEYGINILQGNETDINWSLIDGAAGIVPVCANYQPSLFASVIEANIAKDKAKLDLLQNEINSLRETLLIGNHNWIAGMMYGLSTLGMGNGKPMDPIQMVGEEKKQLIENLKNLERVF